MVFLPSLPQQLEDPAFEDEDSPYLYKVGAIAMRDMIFKETPYPSEWLKGAVPIPGTGAPGYSEIYRNASFPNGLKRALTAEMDTFHKIFKNSVNLFHQKPCFGYRKYDYATQTSAPEYTTFTYDEVEAMKKDLGAGLLFLLTSNPYKNPSKYESHAKIDNHVDNYKHYNEKNISFILTICASNRWEWMLTDLMCSSYSITSTSLYDTLGPDSSQYILALTETPVIVSSKNHIKSLIELKKGDPEKLGNIISIISMDPLFREDKWLVQYADSVGIKLFEYSQVLEVGRLFPLKELVPHYKTVYAISFTSGTTGSHPKGVLLLQQASAACAVFALTQVNHLENWRSFCFLPLAHIYERQMSSFTLTYGGCIGFPKIGGGPLTLIEDLKLWKPHFMPNVPRIYTKLEAALKTATIESDSILTRQLFTKAINYKIAAQEEYDGAEGRHFIYDKFFISKLRASLGFDNMQIVSTGSAPISPSTIKFLKAALGIGISQGYGLTESFGGVSFGIPYEANPGGCGTNGISSEMRIRELPEMGYHINDADGARGELLLRGPQISPGYFKNEAATKEAFDEDGWFHTGDVARMSKDGKIFIIDRVKNFFKLSQGEYITPEKVENHYLSNNPILTQVYTHGDPMQHFLVGVVGLERELCVQFLVDKCKVNAADLQTPEKILEYCNKFEIKKQILEYLNGNIADKLKGFEKLHNIYIEFEPLRIDRNVVTPSLKLRRPIAKKFFSDQIQSMYSEGSLIKKDTKL
ncbi:long-chain fatty acid CoA ligase [Scheffersomyces amazonensis]|uniref:long-chain fatty acid CoA ligase n=1 Tax=Scheffersomyces amazonensis TaxID=1078765 RepID=UPI00315D5BE6